MKIGKILFTILFGLIINNLAFSQTTDEAYDLFSKGNKCLDAQDYKNAIYYYQKAVPAYEKTYGKTHLYTGDVYFLLGHSYSEIRDYQNAITWLEKSFEVFNSPNGDKLSAADALRSLGGAYLDNSYYDKALEYYQNELDLRKKISGKNKEEIAKNNKETANCYSNIGLAYEFKGEYKTALSYFQKALEIRKKLFGENSLEVASSYRDIGAENYWLGNYNNASDYFFKTLEIRERLLGEENLEVAQSLQDLVTASIGLEYYSVALKWSEKIEEIYNKLQVPQISQEFAILYNERGRIYYSQSDFKQALIFNNKTLEINTALYGDRNIYTAKAYSKLGLTYKVMGDYSRAVANLEKALDINKSIFGNSHPDIALVYRELSEVYIDTKNFDKALSYCNQALEMYKKHLGEKHIDIANCYSDIGVIYEKKKDYEKAIENYRKAINITREIFGYDTTNIAQAYSNIARIYEICGDYDEAETLHKAAINIYTEILGKNNSAVAIEYTNLGWHYAGRGNTKKAVESFKNSYEGFKNSTNYSQDISALASILRDSTLYRYDTDTGFIRETLALAIDAVERARLDMNSMKSDILQQSLPVYYYGVDFEAKNNNPEKSFEYSEMLRSRGFLDQIGLDRALKFDGITETEKEQIRNLITQITIKRAEIEKQNGMELEIRDTKKLAQAAKELAKAESELFKLDEKIGKRVPQYAQLRNPQPVKIKDAQKWCGNNRAVLEYVMYKPEDENQEPYLYCIVLTKKKINIVKLDEKYDYDEEINKLRERISSLRPETQLEKLRNELHEKLIEPVMPYLIGVKEVVIVPDSSLAFLPFDVLRKNYDERDLGQKFAISLSPSVSVSMISDTVKSNGDTALAFGAAWYDTTLSDAEHRGVFSGVSSRGAKRGNIDINFELKADSETQRAAIRQNILQNGPAEYFAGKNLVWQNLPGTLTELNLLEDNIFRKKIDLKTQRDATEKLVKKMSATGELAKFPILHFALHGYFDSNISEMSSVLFSEVSGKIGDSTEDGYLTISEASVLSMNADVVCLSACETGRGEMRNGDGMVGLARAFMVAGAKTVCVSLWSIDDEATAEFMLRMYKEAQKAGVSYTEAYRKVKEQMRNSEEWSHPYYWAAFTLYE